MGFTQAFTLSVGGALFPDSVRHTGMVKQSFLSWGLVEIRQEHSPATCRMSTGESGDEALSCRDGFELPTRSPRKGDLGLQLFASQDLHGYNGGGPEGWQQTSKK
jgi:hypothetical protein